MVNAMKIAPDPARLSVATQPAMDPHKAALMVQARALEAAFLSEMLSHTGLGVTQEEFGGGIGEAQFSSFLRQEQANLMVARGGIGLAEQLFRSMTRNGDAAE